MTTLKDKIRDAVMEYHKDVAPDPEVLTEAICEEIRVKLLTKKRNRLYL